MENRKLTEVELSIVAPCYNEEASVATFLRTMKTELGKLDLSWEIICVNDGSIDATLDLLIGEARQDSRIKVVDLSRNFGKKAALTAGLDVTRGRAVVPIDVDLQDPPELRYAGEMARRLRRCLRNPVCARDRHVPEAYNRQDVLSPI